MEFGDEVIEMSAIVNKEWRDFSCRYAGTPAWVREMLVDLLKVLLVLGILLFSATYVLLLETDRLHYIPYYGLAIGLTGFIYSVYRSYKILYHRRLYLEHRTLMNREIARNFDVMMSAKYSWYNLNSINQ